MSKYKISKGLCYVDMCEINLKRNTGKNFLLFLFSSLL